jgi:hypothetical protein
MDAKQRLEKGLNNLCGEYENQQIGVNWEITRDDLEYVQPRWVSETPPDFTVLFVGDREIQIPLTPKQKEFHRQVAEHNNHAEAQRCLNDAEGWAEAKRGVAMSPVDGPITWGPSPRYYTDQREKANPIAVMILVAAAAFVLVGLVMIVVGALHSSGVIIL